MRPELAAAARRNALALFREQAAEILRVRPRRKVSEWAEQERWLAQGVSPLSAHGPIRYRLDVMPWCREPMDSAVDPEVQATVLWWASGMAKTETVANVMGYSVHERPANIFAVYPKEDSRDKFSRDVIERMIDSTPALNDLFVVAKSRDAGRTIGYKRFAGGSMFLTSAGSASNFRGPRAGVVYLDEVDAMPDDVDGEGDPVALAFKRAEGFADSIKFISGTGTFTPEQREDGTTRYRSRIHFWHEQGDCRKWFVPCRECGAKQVLTWAHMRIPKSKPEDARIACERCGAEHDDAQRMAMVRAGEWQPTRPFRGVRSYWLHGVNSLLPAEKGFTSKLHQFAVEAERALADKNLRRAWINTFCAELDNPESEGEPPPSWIDVFNRREDYNDGRGNIVVPRGALVLTVGADVQKNRIEVLWQGNGRNEETWCIARSVLYGDSQDAHVWGLLEKELTRDFAHELGGRIGLTLGLLDAGKWPGHVHDFLARLRAVNSPVAGKVRACRGSAQFPHPLIDVRYKTLAKNLKGHWIGTDAAKDAIYSRLRLTREDDTTPRGWRHYPLALEEEFFQQLTAESVQVEFRHGVEMRRYRNPKRLRNEALDMSVYAEAAMALYRVRALDFDSIERELTPRPEAENSPQPAVTEPRRAPVTRNSFVGAGTWRI